MVYIWASPTRIIGLTAFATTCAVCVAGWWAGRERGRPSSLFAVLAMVQAAFVLDMAFDWRWKLNLMLAQTAVRMGLYDQRRPPQFAALILLSVLAALAALAILIRFRRRIGAGVAVSGTMLSCALWCTEWVSYHRMDQFLYHLVGGAMLVSFFWMGNAAVTCFGVWLDSRGA